MRLTDVSQRNKERMLAGGQILVEELLRKLPGIFVAVLLSVKGCVIGRRGWLPIYYKGGG